MMSFSYSGDPTTSVADACRFILGDTDESNVILQDEEIGYIIEQTGTDENRLKYTLFMHAATRFARDIKRSLGPQSEDPTDRLNYFKQQMEYYKRKTESCGVSIPKYAHPKVFHKGMQNNPPYPSKDRGVF